jgi:hypothetical protein
MGLRFCLDDGPIQLWVPGDPVPPEFVEAARNPDWIIAPSAITSSA